MRQSVRVTDPDGLLGAADVRALAERLGVRPTKQRGQNFVIDGNTVRRIVRTAELREDDVVIEVGPGLGSLTLALLPHSARVVAVEIDQLLAGALAETVTSRRPDLADRLEVVTADALTVTSLPGPDPTARTRPCLRPCAGTFSAASSTTSATAAFAGAWRGSSRRNTALRSRCGSTTLQP